MMKLLLVVLSLITLSSCWPTSVSFKDSGSMPLEWKAFHMKTLEINAANCPLFYAAQLSEKLKDGIQNNTRLSLATKLSDAEVQIEGQILNYQSQAILLETETPSESPLPAWPQHTYSYQTDRVSQCQNPPLDTKLSAQLTKLS
jgi:hypothetical protein